MILISFLKTLIENMIHVFVSVLLVCNRHKWSELLMELQSWDWLQMIATKCSFVSYIINISYIYHSYIAYHVSYTWQSSVRWWSDNDMKQDDMVKCFFIKWDDIKKFSWNNEDGYKWWHVRMISCCSLIKPLSQSLRWDHDEVAW